MLSPEVTLNSQSITLVTGASGFIGERLAQRLVQAGWSVRLLVRDLERTAPGLRCKCEVLVGDLGDEAALRNAVRSVEVIFHCAANVKTWDRSEAYHQVNVLGVRMLLEAIAAENPGLARLVHLSTADVYGFPAEPCDENCATSGGGFAYGETKLLGESMIRERCSRANIPYTIIRPCNVIGPRSQFIVRIGEALRSGVMLEVDGGRVNAGLVHVDNLVDHVIWAARAEQAIGRCYNVRDPYDVTWAQFIGALRRAIDGKGIVIDLPFGVANAIARAIEIFYRSFMPAREPLLHRLLVRIFGRTCGHSAERIRKDSGIVGKVGFDEAMDESIRWFFESCGRGSLEK